MRRRKTQNSNLFAIDFDAIENVLQDANAPLISAAEDLLDRGSLIQEVVDTSDAENLKEIVAQIRDQGKQLSKARLSDGRPFTDASSLVKNWFGKTEDRLKALDRRLSGILASYVSRVAAEAEEVRRRNDERERAAAASQPSNDVPQDVQIGSSLSGESIVTVNTPEVAVPVEQEVELEIEPEVPDVKLEWQVKSFNRGQLNLEEIAPYLTDNAIKVALNAHLKDNGPNVLNGVTYEQVVAKKISS